MTVAEVEELIHVDHWSQVDPNYEDIPVSEDDPEVDVEEEEEPGEEEDAPYGGTGEPLRPFWVRYELHGRNLDAETVWELLASEDFDGSFEVEVEHLTAGARWEFRLRLLDERGRASRWSDPLQVQLPTDFTPPPAPTPPTATDNNGFITHVHDGTLLGPVPRDMSHRVLYAQQLHPAGEPEGVAGDPFRVAEFRGSESATITTGRYVDRVAHRAWLTAVDTSGNESPWSDFVEFTPSQPVDGEMIRAELEKINGRVGEGFEESLTEAIAGADQRIDSLAVGDLFVENAIKAPAIDVQDLAANVARMNELWVGLANISEAQIDTLLANSGKFKTIQSASISGGSLRTSNNSNQGVVINDGEVILTTGWEDADTPGEVVSSYDTAFIEMNSGQSNQVITPKIWVDDDGQMRISPGRTSNVPQHRGMLRIHGDIRTNRFHASYGEFANRVNTWGSGWNTLAGGITVQTSDSRQPGRFVPDGPRMRLQGRLPDDQSSQDMIIGGSAGGDVMSAGGAVRGTIVYGQPAEVGSRRPLATTHVANTAFGYDQWRVATVSTAALHGESFRYIVRAASENAGNVQAWVYYTAIWQ